MEMQIPIPSLEDGSPDWSIVSRAWWDAVDLIQKSEERGVFAVDMALELRIMGGSDVLMAPQFGNKHGTLAIEPVSTRIVHKEIWEDFKEELAKVWMSYKDFDGSLLLSRIHWAKESPRSVTIDEVFCFNFSYFGFNNCISICRSNMTPSNTGTRFMPRTWNSSLPYLTP